MPWLLRAFNLVPPGSMLVRNWSFLPPHPSPSGPKNFHQSYGRSGPLNIRLSTAVGSDGDGYFRKLLSSDDHHMCSKSVGDGLLLVFSFINQ